MKSIYPVPEPWRARAFVDADAYAERYRQSIDDPDAFWRQEAARLEWHTPFSRTSNVSFEEAHFRIRSFEDGGLNASTNCLDRHLDALGDRPAILWEPDEPGPGRTLTYRELHQKVCRFANVLKSQGVSVGDRVTIYLPMIPEAVIAMLACARIGAIHSVVFGGFSPDALADRIQDCASAVVLTADQGIRGGKVVPLKENVDVALARCPVVTTVIVVAARGVAVDMTPGRDHWWHEVDAGVTSECDAEPVAAEHPLFVLYTSGSTGKPKGVVHSTAGYLLWASMTHRYVFDYRPGEVYWLAADVGWVAGHSFVLYGPLANGATVVMYEGIPTYPTPGRVWEICDKLGVNTFLMAPTGLRSLMREDEQYVRASSRASLRLLGTLGEPINPEVWDWYYRVVGEERCPIIDTWWQTETGAAMIAPMPGATSLKPGSATLPMFGVRPTLLAPDGMPLDDEAEGSLVLASSWPGQARTLWKDDARFFDTYFRPFPGYYFTGDGCRRDADGYYWITGRIDDVMNVSGHRIGTAEVESALVAHRLVAEAAVVSIPHDLKGESIRAFVTLVAGAPSNRSLIEESKARVRREVGGFAVPDRIVVVPSLPKTRSGKIMRRILRYIAQGRRSEFGDVSTLAEPSVIDDLLAAMDLGEAG